MSPPKQKPAPGGAPNLSKTTRQQAAQSTRSETEESNDDLQTIPAESQSITGSASEMAQLRHELQQALVEIRQLRKGQAPSKRLRPTP